MNLAARRLFARIARAHGLSFRERRLCRRVAALSGLDGHGGIETSPAAVFFLPRRWAEAARGAREGENRLDALAVASLAGRLFALPPDDLPDDWEN